MLPAVRVFCCVGWAVATCSPCHVQHPSVSDMASPGSGSCRRCFMLCSKYAAVKSLGGWEAASCSLPLECTSYSRIHVSRGAGSLAFRTGWQDPPVTIGFLQMGRQSHGTVAGRLVCWMNPSFHKLPLCTGSYFYID